MRPLSGREELPLDVRRHGDGEAADAGLMKAVLDALPSPTVLLDPHGTIVMGNSAWTAAGEEHGRHIAAGADYYASALLLSDDDAARFLVHALQQLARGERAEVSIDRSLPNPAGAGTLWFHVQGSRVDRTGHVVVTHTDVTSRVLAERTSAWQARHDHLTELPNRAHLHELIDAELQRPDRPAVAVLFLDVDGFKDVNDSLGHDVGDELLRQMAGRLLAGTRGQDTVGRLGGDEFVVLCRDCDADGAEHLARRCQAALRAALRPRRPFRPAQRQHRHRRRRPGRRPDAAVDRPGARRRPGDVRGQGRRPQPGPPVQPRPALGRAAAHAAGRPSCARRSRTDQLVLHYQPVIHLPTGDVNGAEALVRWQHPERGLVLALRLHPRGRAVRPDRSAHPLGAGHGDPAGRRVALRRDVPAHRRQRQRGDRGRRNARGGRRRRPWPSRACRPSGWSWS